jgi:hypothetical protein
MEEESYTKKFLSNKKKYNNHDFTILLALNNQSMIIDALKNNNIDDDFILETYLFIVLYQNSKFQIISQFIKNKKIKNIEECFNFFIENLNKNNNCANLFDLFIKSGIEPQKEHFDFAIKGQDINIIISLIENHNFDLSSNQLENLLSKNNKITSEEIESILHNMKLDEKVLNIVCQYGYYDNICHVLNNKMKPTQENFISLFKNKHLNVKQTYLNNTIDMLIKFEYKLTNEDIIFASKNKIILNDSDFTKNFIPTEEFYDLCDEYFKPIYNDTIKNDINEEINKRKNIRHRAEKEKILQKEKERKDLNKSKLKGFMLFADQKRNKVKAMYPDLKITEIAKKLGEMWNKLSYDEKRIYKE